MRAGRRSNTGVTILVVVTAIVLAFVLGIVFGKFVLSTGNNESTKKETQIKDGKGETLADIQTDTVTEPSAIVTEPPTEPTTEPPSEPETEPTRPYDKIIALTFDDGPNPDTTTRVLDVLQEYGGKATFFVLGSRLDNYPKTLKLINESGCEIGNHTFNHHNLNELSPDNALKEVTDAEEKIRSIVETGNIPVRLPYGNGKEEFRKKVSSPIINWSVDTEDWKSRDSEVIVQQILDNVRDGDIILMHDIYDFTAEAVEKVVPILVEQGYRLATVSELFEEKGIPMENGKVYYSAWQAERELEKEQAADTEDTESETTEEDTE